MDRHYPNLARDKATLARKFRVGQSTLRAIYDRGVRAHASASGRVPGSPFQWGYARMYRFLLIEAGKIPPDKTHPDNRLHTTRIRKKIQKLP